MAVAQRPGLFTPKPTDTLVAEAEERGHSLKRVVGREAASPAIQRFGRG